MRPRRQSPVLVALGGLATVALLAGCSASAPPVRSTAPPPAPTSTAPPPTTASPTAPPSAPRLTPVGGQELGAPDLNAYCRHLGYDGAKSLAGVAYAWVCATGNRMSAVDENGACRWQYGLGAAADTANINDPNSWQCWSIG